MASLAEGRLVEELYRRADAARWQVPLDRFAGALEASAAKMFAGRTPSAGEVERYLGSLRLAELALACACVEGNSAAWDHFVLEYRPILYRAADAMEPGGAARELADSLYADLFGLDVGVPSPTPDAVSGFSRTGHATGAGAGVNRPGEEGRAERKSLFRYYHGRSGLATWLRAVLAQRLVDRARAAARTVPLPDEEPAGSTPHTADPDRPRYVALLHAAFRDAVARLDARDRLRLRYYYSQGLTLAGTGRLLREHEASVSRHLSSARKAIRHDVERYLREAGLAPDEVARCFECVSEDPGPLDLETLLAEGPAARNPQPDVQRKGSSAGAAADMVAEKSRGRMKR